MNKKTSWGEVAKWYDDMIEGSDDSYQSKVILPNLLRIVEPKSGSRILDLACGQGFFARAMNEKGAKMTGCDISSELIEIAKKNSPKDIEYRVAFSDKLSFAADGSFDVVTIVLALQNIENLASTLSECARVLKPGGRSVLVMNHPAFRIPRSSSWQWDETAAAQYRRIDAYMSERENKIDMTPGENQPDYKRFTVSFHRPLQVYFKALNKAGLVTSRLEEWISHKVSQKGPRAAEEDRMRKEIPMFICLESRKLS